MKKWVRYEVLTSLRPLLKYYLRAQETSDLFNYSLKIINLIFWCTHSTPLKEVSPSKIYEWLTQLIFRVLHLTPFKGIKFRPQNCHRPNLPNRWEYLDCISSGFHVASVVA